MFDAELAPYGSARVWTPRSTLRWGANVELVIPAGALDRTTDQLIHVQAPAPCIWRVCMVANGFLAGDAATLRFVLDVGVGSMTARTEGDPSGTPAGIISGEVAAQTIYGRVRLQSAAVLAQRNVTVSLWAAPIVPFDGLCVCIGGTGDGT